MPIEFWIVASFFAGQIATGIVVILTMLVNR